MDLDWLDDFMEVVQRGSISEAARVRGLNQSSLSRRIRSLEEWCGSKLLDRTAVPIKVTEQGQILLETAMATSAELKSAQSRIKASAPSSTNVIQIYALHTLAATFVPMYLRVMRQRMQVGEFELETSTSAANIRSCVDAVCYGDAHFMISYESARERVTLPSNLPPGKIESITIAKDRLIPVAGKQIFETFKERMKGEENCVPLATYSAGTYLHGLVETKLKELQVVKKLPQIDVAQMSETLRNLARQGQGIAWVLLSTAENALKRKELYELKFGTGTAAHIDLDIKLFRAPDNTSPAIERIWALSKTLGAELSPEMPMIPGRAKMLAG
jgi:DNA-binding transcriptional LysR family regulator